MQEPNGAWYTPSYAAKDVMPIIAIPVSPHTCQSVCYVCVLVCVIITAVVAGNLANIL